MEIKNNIDELHSIIEKSTNHSQTFINNLELWKSFYNDRFTIIRNNILNPKLFTIIKFLLEQEKGEIFEYFHSNIISEVDKQQKQLAFNLANSTQKSQADINKLLNNLHNHDNLLQTLESLTIDDTFNDIKRFRTKQLELETIDSLILSLHSQFFSLEPEVVKKSIDFIEKEIIILQNSDVKNNLMNTDLIFQYLSKIFPLKTFVGKNLSEDNLIKEIKEHQLQEKKLLLKLFKELSPDIIYEIFDANLNNILIFITEVDYIDEFTKINLINILFDKMLKEDYYLEFLKLIITENKNPLWNQYLTSDRYNQIIINSLNMPIFFMESDMIKYLLTIELKPSKKDSYIDTLDFLTAKSIFKFNCQSLINKKGFIADDSNFDKEGIKEILLNQTPNISAEDLTISSDENYTKKIEKQYFLGTDIDFNIAIELLDKYFQNQNKLSSNSVQAIIKSIATEFQKQLEIENNGLYFFKANKVNGTFYYGYNTITINGDLVTRFLSSRLPLYKRLQIFITMFHEIKHAKINQNRKDNIWTIDAYEMEKENIARDYDINFYTNNYQRNKEEISARISGYDSLLKFIETYFSEYLLDQIQDKILLELENEKSLNQQQNSERVMTFLGNQQVKFNIGFDTIIRYNPNILKYHPILNLEYYKDGTPKTYEDIWIDRTEENKELIDGILMKRYPESTDLTKNHTK